MDKGIGTMYIKFNEGSGIYNKYDIVQYEENTGYGGCIINVKGVPIPASFEEANSFINSNISIEDGWTEERKKDLEQAFKNAVYTTEPKITPLKILGLPSVCEFRVRDSEDTFFCKNKMSNFPPETGWECDECWKEKEVDNMKINVKKTKEFDIKGFQNFCEEKGGKNIQDIVFYINIDAYRDHENEYGRGYFVPLQYDDRKDNKACFIPDLNNDIVIEFYPKAVQVNFTSIPYDMIESVMVVIVE